jgi:predicted nucleotidyltransferase
MAAFCRRSHVRRLAFFGSVLRSDFRPDSDIDILIEFEPGHVPGLAFFALQDELAQMLGHRVDLHTPASLSS